MRTLKDRIRHTLLFEGIALTLIAIFGSWITGHSMQALGILSLMFSLLAMTWNLAYNWLFDLWDRKYRNMAPRGAGIRAVHALLFEAVLMTVGTVPHRMVAGHPVSRGVPARPRLLGLLPCLRLCLQLGL